MLIKRAGRFTWSDVTDPRCLLSRRALLAGSILRRQYGLPL